MRTLFTRIKNFISLDLSLQDKLLLSHTSLILISTLIMCVFFYNFTYNTIVNNTITSEQLLSGQTQQSIGATLTSIERGAASLLQQLEEVGGETFLSITPKNSHMFYENIKQNANTLSNGSIVNCTKIYIDDSYEYLMNHNDDEQIICPISDISSSYWYGIFTSTQEEFLLCPSLYLTPSERTNYGELAYIVREKIPDTGKYMYLALYFSQESIASHLNQNMNVTGAVSYIINDRDVQVATSSAELSGAYYMTNETLMNNLKEIDTFGTGTYLNESIYIGYYEIGTNDWYLVTILPKSSLLSEANSLLSKFLIFFICFVILALIFSYFISKSISARINVLAKHMTKQIKNPRPQNLISTSRSKDEIGLLMSSYNIMIDELNSLMDEQEAASIRLRHSEFRALQAQINPHFLYNTLDMINWMCMAGEQDKASDAIRTLSRFYKLSLSKRQEIATLSSEIEHIQTYVKLMNMRFDQRISFIIDIPYEFQDQLIPKLTLQPIVENAILHGIMEKDSKTGTILITGWQQGEDIILQISDDGIGMTDDALLHVLDERAHSRGNIGVYNTDARLKLLFGSDYGLTYSSITGEGTQVEIKMKLKKQITEQS